MLPIVIRPILPVPDPVCAVSALVLEVFVISIFEPGGKIKVAALPVPPSKWIPPVPSILIVIGVLVKAEKSQEVFCAIVAVTPVGITKVVVAQLVPVQFRHASAVMLAIGYVAVTVKVQSALLLVVIE